jgi:subtilisin-like proprotein convertase family protein
MTLILLLLSDVVRCSEDYPFYIKNTGKEYGIEEEDIRLVSVWEQGLTGKGVNIRFIVDGCNVNHELLKNNYNSECSFNFNANSMNMTEGAFKKDINTGTAVASICCASKNDKNVYGIAPNASFSVSVASNKNKNVIEAIQKYYYFRNHDDIIVDTTTHSVFPSYQKIYTKTRVQEVEEMLDEVVAKGRNGKGSILLISTERLSSAIYKRSSLFESYTQAFLISQSDYIGGEGPTPFSNPATLCNAPSYGNTDSIYSLSLHPQILAADGSSNTEVRNTTEPFTHLSIAAGVIALMLEKNPNLTRRDILWILALSCTQNDPLHPSWANDGRILKHSPIYGFGRVNASEAVRLVSLWSSDCLEPLLRYECSYENISINIPHARMGKLELNFTVLRNKSHGCVENVIFRFNTSISDISMMRIILESPKRKKIELLKPDHAFASDKDENYYRNEYFQIIVRGFMSEQAGGIWKLTIIDSSFFKDIKLTYASLVIEYMDSTPNMPMPVISSARASEYPLNSSDQRISLTIAKKTITCGQKHTGILTLDGKETSTTSLFLQDRNSGKTFPLSNVRTGDTFEFEIPCIYATRRSWYLCAQNRAENLFKSVSVTLLNPNNRTGFSSPVAYENIVFQENETARILPSILDDKMALSSNGVGSQYMIAAYNINTNKKVLFQNYSFPGNPGYLYLKARAEKPSRAVLVAVAIDQEKPDPCHTFIVPIIYRKDNEPEVTSFAVPLNNFCPIPMGVVTKKPDGQDKSEFITYRTIIIITVSLSVGVLFLGAMVIWICCEKKKKQKKPLELYDQILL